MMQEQELANRLEAPDTFAQTPLRRSQNTKAWLEQSGPLYRDVTLERLSDWATSQIYFERELSYASEHLLRNAKPGEIVTLKVRVR